jgi:NAD(P)H-hydrate repair Nnr-like enzyme with NAD(P)H-hydrate dehydratase domain
MSEPFRRLEDRIGELCTKAVATTHDSEFSSILEELREALRSHTERVRKLAEAKLSAGLPVEERRREPSE